MAAGNVFRFLYGMLGGRARQAEDIYPYLVKARDFFNEAVARGGAYSSDFMREWGEIERRLEEFNLRDIKLRGHVQKLLDCSKEAFGWSPESKLVWLTDDRPPTPEDIERQKRFAKVGEVAHDCEQHALNALRRTSELAGAAF